MKRSTTMLALVALMLAGPTGAQTAKAPTVKEIMARVNKPGGSFFQIARELKQDEPGWNELQSQAKELAQLAALLGKSPPPRGEKASWEKLAKTYADNAVAVQQAIDNRDRKAALAAVAVLGDAASCKACHAAHRK
jgi:hypothetical protein